jgi:hypothetical protein
MEAVSYLFLVFSTLAATFREINHQSSNRTSAAEREFSNLAAEDAIR